MTFLIKKILSALILPIPIVIILLLIGVWLLCFSQHTTTGKSFIFSGLIVLLIFSTPFVPTLLLQQLETQYQPIEKPAQQGEAIVVLGAGNGGYSHYPANNKLSSASLARLIEGIRLYKMENSGKLILSGGRVFGSPPDATMMNNVASMLGIPAQDIVVEAGSEDTYHEAVHLKKIIGTAPFLLVTSAFHMPRSMALFKAEGMHPTPAPTQLLLGSSRFTVKTYLPNSRFLTYSDIAIHEYLGILWGRITGVIS